MAHKASKSRYNPYKMAYKTYGTGYSRVFLRHNPYNMAHAASKPGYSPYKTNHKAFKPG